LFTAYFQLQFSSRSAHFQLSFSLRSASVQLCFSASVQLRTFRSARFLHETRLELSIALARGKALMIDAARDKLAGITAQRAHAGPQ
jgi:hypothetical protein